MVLAQSRLRLSQPFLLVILLFAILVPVLYKQLVQFAAQLPDLAARIEAKARPLLDSFADLKANNQADRGILKDLLAGTAVFARKGRLYGRQRLGALANAAALLIVTPSSILPSSRLGFDRRKVDGWLPRAHRNNPRAMPSDRPNVGRVCSGTNQRLYVAWYLYAIGLTALGLPFERLLVSQPAYCPSFPMSACSQVLPWAWVLRSRISTA